MPVKKRPGAPKRREGMVVRGAHSPNAAEMKRLLARARAVGMQIARGRIPDDEE